MSNFITEALDSKLVCLDDFSYGWAQANFLRLRLHILFRVLVGDTVVVPQGWALDSLPFLRVASEIVSAIKRLRSENHSIEDFHLYSPLKMECHIGKYDYLHTLLRYLQRDDCAWSGFPVLRREPERRKEFCRLIKNIIDVSFSIYGQGQYDCYQASLQ